MNRVTVNEQVSVTQLGFKKNLSTYPRQMEFRGAVYDFIDAGLSCLINMGDRASSIVTVSDGRSQYRLRSDNHGGNWTLLTISQ